MKITIEYLDHKATLEDDSVVEICDALDLVEKALMKVGYQQKRIHGAILFKAKEIEENSD